MAKFKKFLPNLNLLQIRRIRDLIKENSHQKRFLPKLFSDEVDIFDNDKNIEDSVETFLDLDRETISYQACCALISDLLKAGWEIELGLDGLLLIKQPEYSEVYNSISKVEVKEKMRQVQLVNRDKHLQKAITKDFLQKMEKKENTNKSNIFEQIDFLKNIEKKVDFNENKSILSIIDDGRELAKIFSEIIKLDPKDQLINLRKVIKPEIYLVYSDDSLYKDEQRYCPYTGLRLSEIWKYFRYTWSSEYKSNPGKELRILIRNAGRPNKPIIGIGMLRSAALSDQARDSYLGFYDEETIRKKVFKKEINLEFLVNTLLRVLNEQINSIKYDDFDFITPDKIKNPNKEIIKKLLNIYDKELAKKKEESDSKLDIEAFEDELDQSELTSMLGKKKLSPIIDYDKESRKPLFLKKRALKLARLLEARKIFNQVELKKNPIRGYATLIKVTKNGTKMINRILKEIKTKILSENILDLSVCGSIAPYNEILGGKLIASLFTSEDIRKLFRKRYNSKKYKKPSIIASSIKGSPVYRDSNLMCITTTSLYGTSSQYNRIKFPKKNFQYLEHDLVWKEVFKDNKRSHKTKGKGVYHISNETTKLLSILSRMILGRKEINHVMGEGTSPKLRKIILGISLLLNKHKSEVQADDFLSHNIKRKNYIFHYDKNVLEKLLSQKKVLSSTKTSNIDMITKAWIERWLLKRIKRKETIDNLKHLGPEIVSKSLRPEDKNNILKFKKI